MQLHVTDTVCHSLNVGRDTKTSLVMMEIPNHILNSSYYAPILLLPDPADESSLGFHADASNNNLYSAVTSRFICLKRLLEIHPSSIRLSCRNKCFNQ